MSRTIDSSSVIAKPDGWSWLRRLFGISADRAKAPPAASQPESAVITAATQTLALDVEGLRQQFDRVSQQLDQAMCELAKKDQELEAARRESLCDPLTGLYNRRAADVLLGREIALATRHQVPFCMAVIDVDHFKQVNDTYGHAFGDQTLISVAEAIRQSLRKTDLAFRMGGDEFVVALPQTNVGSAAVAMEKLRASLTAIWAGHDSGFCPTLSVGLVQQSALTESWQALLQSADEALYCGKRRSRNCVYVPTHSAAPIIATDVAAPIAAK